MRTYPDGGTDDDANETEESEFSRPVHLQTDRERAILTESDRKYLLGEKQISEEAERNARYRIRNRITHGLMDLNLLSRWLSESDHEQVFSKEETRSSVIPILEFLYEGVQLNHESPEEGSREFAQLLESAVNNVERNKFGKLADVTFVVDRREPDPDKLFKKIERGDATMDEFAAFLDVGDQSRLSTLLERDEPIKMRFGETKEDVTPMVRNIVDRLSTPDSSEHD